jgi:hypothetical protein
MPSARQTYMIVGKDSIISEPFWIVVWRWIWDGRCYMKTKFITRMLVILGSLMIIADMANFFPEKAGTYAIAGAILVAAGILVRADN